MRGRIQFVFYSLFALLITVADQVTKLLVLKNIPLHGNIPSIKGLFHLTYVQNTGAAFSSFQGMRWLFVAIFLVLTVAVIWEYFKKPLPLSVLERWCIAAVYGGALGNIIDRVRLGYVVDMICVDFINFPVFNVADCFSTCGCFALILHVIFLNKQFWKDEKK